MYYENEPNLNMVQMATNGVNRVVSGVQLNGGLRITSGQTVTFPSTGFVVTGDGSVGGTAMSYPNYQEELEKAGQRRETPPFHWWSPDPSGHVCRICDFDNIYRGSKADHMPIIFEEPDEEEWRDQL